MDNWAKKDHASGKYFPRPPFAGRLRSVPLWEKKFCESIGLIPWHKLLEAKRFMYLYEDVNKWNDTAAKEAFKNAKSRFWAEMNGLPCNIKLPDPDIYIEKVDWNTCIDPELLSDLERGPDIQSNTVGAEGDSVMQGIIPFMLESAPIIGSSGWGDIDEVPNPVLPAESAEPQVWVNYHETTNTFSCNDDANQRGSLDLQGDFNISKGWNNWDDDDDDNYASKCDLKESSKKDSKGKVSYSKGNWGHGSYTNRINVENEGSGRNLAPQNNQWRRKDGKGYEGGVRSSQQRADWKVPIATNNNKGKQRHERPHWADRTPSYGRW